MMSLLFLSVFLMGFFIVHLTSRNSLFPLEKTGLSFPVGLGITTFIMFLMELAHIPLNLKFIISIVLIVTIGLSAISIFLRKKWPLLNFEFKWPSIKDAFKTINLSWLLFFSVIIYLLYGITMKCMFWIPFEHDSVAGFDLYAKMIAHTQGMLSDIFEVDNKPVSGTGARFVYPPFLALANSLCYMGKMESARILTPLMYISFLLLFYGLLKRYTTSLAAILFTLLLLITPEMMAHVALSQTNIPCAIYASSAAIFLILWFYKRVEAFFYLSLILMTLNIWVRSDSIVFNVAAITLLGIDALKNKTWKKFFMYSFICVIPLLSWTFFLKANGIKMDNNVFIKYLYWDYDKLKTIFDYWYFDSFSTSYYGIAYHLFFIVLLLNIRSIILKKDMLLLISFYFMVHILYSLLIYQVDPKSSAGSDIPGFMTMSYKRYVFCFIPLMYFYIASNNLLVKAFKKIDDYLLKS